MIPISRLFHAMTDKMGGHGASAGGTGECCTHAEKGVTITAEHVKRDEEAGTTKDLDTVEDDPIDGEKELELAEPVKPVPTHSAQCPCHNCEEIVARFAECGICLEPLQGAGTMACAWCGGVWCSRCSRRMSRCAYCRAPQRSPAQVNVALGRLINEMALPCRNYRRGCTEYLTALTRAMHEEQCKFDQIICPIDDNCCSVAFEDLSTHLQESHSITSIYSAKVKILIENFQTKLKKTACCRTKYKIVLLYHKSAFIVKVCIYNYHVKVEVMRRRLGYSAEIKESKKSDYCALIEFQSRALSTKSAVLIENQTYSKKAEAQWNEISLKPDSDEAITIHVNIGKSNGSKENIPL